MKRLLMEKLSEWHKKKNRKPLILWGARQVGKTWLMKKFGEEYFQNTVYISLYKNKRIASFFDEDYNPHRIIKAIEIELHVKIHPDKTLLIFDEIQNEPKVLESLKYFCEEASEYAVIVAGSLLGVALHEGISFPVGKVDELRLFPLSFDEFLTAMNESELLKAIEQKNLSIMNIFSDKLTELLKIYYAVGGMPEVVANYINNQNLEEVRELQKSILNQYEGDFGKHVNEKELPRIRLVWNSIPTQLSKENKKFFFGKIKEGARQKDFEIAIQWLLDSGLVYKVNKVTKPAMPLKAYVDFSSYKLFMLDVGLLAAASEIAPEIIIKGNSIYEEFKGALTEQFVFQQFKASTKFIPYYYSGEKSTYETDFLIQHNGDVLPVEVKAETNTKSKSLKVYCEKFNPSFGIRISMNLFCEQSWMKNYPLWAFTHLL